MVKKIATCCSLVIYRNRAHLIRLCSRRRHCRVVTRQYSCHQHSEIPLIDIQLVEPECHLLIITESAKNKLFLQNRIH